MESMNIFTICPHGSAPNLCPQCLIGPRPEYEWKSGPSRPFKCPCCDGWGKRQAGLTVGTAIQYETCHACLGTGLVWGL